LFAVLAPLLLKLLAALLVEYELTATLLIGQGELFVLAIGLSATALADLVTAGQLGERVKLAALFFCLCNLRVAAACFTLVWTLGAVGRPPSSSLVVIISLVVYAIALGASGLCVALTERRANDVR
jgi:hypothetical protein